MNKNEIVNALREKILNNENLTANLDTINSILNPVAPLFSADLPPLGENPTENLEEAISSATREYWQRAGEIKEFIRTEISKIADVPPLEIIDAYNGLINAIQAEHPETIADMVKYPKESGTGSYKWYLEISFLPKERFLNSAGAEICEPY